MVAVMMFRKLLRLTGRKMLFVPLVFTPPTIVSAVFVRAEMLLVLSMTRSFVMMQPMVTMQFLAF